MIPYPSVAKVAPKCENGAAPAGETPDSTGRSAPRRGRDALSHCLNSPTRAFGTTIRSGAAGASAIVSRLPNHTAISFTARRATMNWRLARKKSAAGSSVWSVSSVRSSGYCSPSWVQAVTFSSRV